MAKHKRVKKTLEQEADNLRGKYDALAAAVADTAPNTPERHRAMKAKQDAFTAWKAKADSPELAAERAESDASHAAKGEIPYEDGSVSLVNAPAETVTPPQA